VVQRLLEHCRQADLKPLIEEILSHSQQLCMDEYGNYVIQELLQRGETEHRHRIAMMLVEQKDNTLFTDCRAGNVVRHALTCCCQPDQCLLANRLLREKGLIATMACQRHGHRAVEVLLQISGGVGQKAAGQLSEKIPELRSSRFGRVLVEALSQVRDDEGAAEIAVSGSAEVPASCILCDQQGSQN